METVKEIATRERAEDALRHSEQLYRTIFENSDDGFMLVEPVYNEIGDARDIRFLKLNSAYEHQTGAKEADVLGKKASDVVPELEPTVISLSVEVAKNGKSTHAENYDKYSNKWYDTQFIPFSEGQVGILFRDITERKTAEETLKEAEEKFKNMIEQSPDVFGLYDKDFFLIQVNLAWDKLWEVPRELAIGKWNPLQSKQVSDIGWIPLIKRAYAGETVDVPEIEFDPSLEPLTMGKGRKRWIKSIIYPIKNIQGEVQNIVMMHQDITDRKLLEKQLEDKERLAVIGQTAGMVGHDIRNPLQAVLSDTYILKDELSAMPECKTKEGVAESIDDIEKNVAYINKIVQDLQDYSRPIAPEIKEANLSKIFVDIFKIVNVPDSIKLSVSVKDAEKIKTDPMLLQRAFTNIVTNAIQAMPDGGNLEINGRCRSNRVIVSISDTGIGIPEEVKSKVFLPMITTKAKGQGFGLAVAKRIIEALKGTITFESEKGKGTRFIIELPSDGLLKKNV